MGRKYRCKKRETYLINITVLEGRHYALANMDSFVQLKVGKMKAKTRTRYGTDSPFYNEYFSFQFDMELELLLDVNVMITVIQRGRCCKRQKVLGYCSLDVGTIYAQPDHQFYQKWAILTSYKGTASGLKGYLKVTISILGRGEVPKIPLVNPLSENDIEGNLLLPKGVLLERQRAQFIFRVYRGHDIIKKNYLTRSIEEEVDETKLSRRERIRLPKVTFRVSFIGLAGKIKAAKKSCHPVFNKSIKICEMYPVLTQRIKLQVFYKHYGKRKLVVKRYLRLTSISSVSEGGYLPTFGPAFIHFYRKTPIGEIYVGKILLSLETKLFSEPGTVVRNAIIDDIPPIYESLVWKTKKVLLFVAILGVSIIDKRYSSRNMSFELNWGRMKLVKDEQNNDNLLIPHFVTPKYHPKTLNHKFWHLEFEDSIPCLHIIDIYPNVRKRLFRANILDKIVTNLEEKLQNIESFFAGDEFVSYSQKIETLLIEFFDYLVSACQKYIDIQKSQQSIPNTELDTLKSEHLLFEMQDIKAIAMKGYNYRMKKKSFRKGQKLTKRLKILIDHPQECWPNVYLWLRSGKHKAECIKIEPRNLVYSAIPEEKGKFCGKINHMNFMSSKSSASLSPIVCKVQMFAWLGLEEQKEDCFKNIPAGYVNKETPSNEIPEFLFRSQSVTFNCRAHIYQGKFQFAYDFTGLSDFFVRIIIYDQVKETMTRPKTLNPVWDETLIFRNITIYGTEEYIKKNPPTIILEVNDRDRCNQIDYVGYALINPKIKLKKDVYGPPEFPPKLQWYRIKNDINEPGAVLAAIEFLEDHGEGASDALINSNIVSIPQDIRPSLKKYRMEVCFWGVRNLKKLHHASINSPRVTLECNEYMIRSEIAKIDGLNFSESPKTVDMVLPDQEQFLPPVVMKLFDSRSFGRLVYGGTHLAYMKQFFYHPITLSDWESRIHKKNKSYDSMISVEDSVIVPIPKKKKFQEKHKKLAYMHWRMNAICSKENILARIKSLLPSLPSILKSIFKWICCCGICKLLCKTLCCLLTCWCKLCKKKKKVKKLSKKDLKAQEKLLNAQKIMVQDTRIPIDIEDDEIIDWWCKYFNSLDDPLKTVNTTYGHNFKIKIYNDELEKQREFDLFQDTLSSYQIYRGKTVGNECSDEGARIGTLKCKIRVYPWDETDLFYKYVNPAGLPLKDGFFQEIMNNDALKFTVRVYCIRGIKFRPSAAAGTCGAFITIKMGKLIVSDKKNYVRRSTNPFFGKCFELVGTFPRDNKIILSIYDWEKSTSTELIGETVIDIENRYYSKHRANCGLQYEFTMSGPTPWRDQIDPTVILSELCLKNNLPPPEYSDKHVYVAGKKFTMPVIKTEEIEGHLMESNDIVQRENLALHVLHHWSEVPVVGCHLVPEHIETRSLYKTSDPGIEQGKIQLWIDIFPFNDLPIPHMVNIRTRAPISYELRVIILNTENVSLNDDNFFGDRKSDIYVKGWVTNPSEAQETDVHYRSMNGEGNFNWRFVFVFDYLPAENMVIERKKQKIFDASQLERKMPCRIILQVWDNDLFSRDDFLGSLTLYLNKFPRGAKFARQCNLKILESAPRINLFKVKRTRGWWPFQAKGGFKKRSLAGKLEAEFELITSEQASTNPVGLGREPPNPLSPPKRPETSFNWLINPFKTFRFILWKNLKWKLLQILLLVLAVLFVLLFFYSVPGYSVKKMFNV